MEIVELTVEDYLVEDLTGRLIKKHLSKNQ